MSVAFNTVPSCPDNPTVLQPMITLAGAKAPPIAPPVVWAARINAAFRESNLAAFCCKEAKITLELVLLPVMNAPNAPMKGDINGNTQPVDCARPLAIKDVIPACSIVTAIATIVKMPIDERRALFTVFWTMDCKEPCVYRRRRLKNKIVSTAVYASNAPA